MLESSAASLFLCRIRLSRFKHVDIHPFKIVAAGCCIGILTHAALSLDHFLFGSYIRFTACYTLIVEHGSWRIVSHPNIVLLSAIHCTE